jgi:hypothetical protein
LEDCNSSLPCSCDFERCAGAGSGGPVESGRQHAEAGGDQESIQHNDSPFLDTCGEDAGGERAYGGPADEQDGGCDFADAYRSDKREVFRCL